MQPLTVSKTPEGVIILTLAGDLTDPFLPALTAAIKDAEGFISNASQEWGRRLQVLLDMTAFTGNYDVGAVDAMTGFARKNAPFIERTAAFGASTTATFAGEIVTELAQRDNIQFFPDETAARAWLEQVA